VIRYPDGLEIPAMLTSIPARPDPAAQPTPLSREDLLRAYRLMQMSRRIDDREILLKRQNKIFFQISGAGHEALACAAGLALRSGYDWIFPYYRDRALCLALGMTAEDMLLGAVGAAADPNSGGRQMPSHWGCRRLNIPSTSSPTGTQFLQAVGCAHASRLLNPQSEEITLVCTGDGATSEGEFWEALNIACLERLALVFLVEDNGYAISVPVEKQTAGGDISKLVEGFPGLARFKCDGTDFVESLHTLREAVAYARERRLPAFVHGYVTRPYSHSLSDDERLYKTAAEREHEAQRDCLTRFPKYLVEHGFATPEDISNIMREVDEELQAVIDRVLAAPAPAPETALHHLYSDTLPPTAAVFAAEPAFSGEPRTMVDAINLTLHEEMARDPRIVVFGEDVADCSREENLAEVKGKGGVFKATYGLQQKFGSARVFNSPIAEASIAGRAIGMAVRGLKPVAEIQFFDYIWPAYMQIRDEMATMRWRSNGMWSCPAVIRVAIGGYLTGGAIYHSQNGEVLFTHNPGLRVVFPSNALDACGLLRTAIRCDDPVLFLEHKRLYREPYNRSPHPGPDYTIPFGKARLAREGTDLTVVTYGFLVQRSLQVAADLEKRTGRSVEVIDLRSLNPYDWDAIAASVKKTSRVVVAHEDTLSFGYGAEICARIAAELFEHLDAPVGRVGALDTWIGYNPVLEDAILPQNEDLLAKFEAVLRY
jgi:2-oxoisovalerate dehydrogenase E1 component